MAYMRKFDISTADGNQIISGDITSGMAGTIITSLALDSDGNQVTLPEATLFVMASSEQTAEVWNEVSGVVAGPILRIMAVKSGIPSNVASLSITAISTDVFPANSGVMQVSAATTLPVSINQMLRAMTYRDAATLQGLVFNASRRVASVAGGAFLDTRFRTGNVATTLLARNIGYTGNGVAASIYRNATYTGTGSSSDINNPNDVNPATVAAIVQTGVTFATGTLTTAIAYSEGNASNQGKGSPQASLGEPVVMAPNTEYILRIESLDTAAQNITAYIAWIEGDPS